MAWFSGITNTVSGWVQGAREKVSNFLNAPAYTITVKQLLMLAGVGVAVYYAPTVYQNVKDSWFPEPDPIEPDIIDKAVDFGKDQLNELLDGLYRTYNRIWYTGMVTSGLAVVASCKSFLWRQIENTPPGKGLKWINQFNPLRAKEKSFDQLRQERCLALAEALQQVGVHADSQRAYMVVPFEDTDGQQQQLTFVYEKEDALRMHRSTHAFNQEGAKVEGPSAKQAHAQAAALTQELLAKMGGRAPRADANASAMTA